MTSGEKPDQTKLLTEVDGLLEELRAWMNRHACWVPLDNARRIVREIAGRATELRKRLTAPLVVATFGGTGTGKSALVNAIVGEECTLSGRERPTTRKPILIMHEEGGLEATDLVPGDFDIKRIGNPLFESLILIDCPDPDTNEAETEGSNLEKLHRLLPHCDVLIYTTTQQKYHSARVNRELALASPGCRLILVQTNADLDVDIRDDWKNLLANEYQIAEMFLIDSLNGLKEQLAGTTPTGDFGRLLELLRDELAESKHLIIRRENLLDLIQTALHQARGDVDRDLPSMRALEKALEDQRKRLIGVLGHQLQDELLTHQRLWERRMLTVLAEYWGISPFSTALRIYNGLGGFLASASLMRARSTAQVAVIGALQGARWFNQRKQEQDADQQLASLASLGLDDSALRESQVLIAGYVQDARLTGDAIKESSIETLRDEAVRIEDKFLGSASQKMDDLIDQLAREQRWSPVSMACEGIFSLFLVYLLLRIGKNFFWDSAFTSTPILDMNFYLPAFIFTTLLAGGLIAFFTWTIRGSLVSRITSLAHELAQTRLGKGLFPRLEQAVIDVQQDCRELNSILERTAAIRSSTNVSSLTGRIAKS